MYIPFGKYRGTDLEDIDPGYLRWCLKKAATDPDGFVGEWATAYQTEIEDALRAGQLSKLNDLPEVTLSPSQAKAVEAIDQQLLQGTNSVMRLQGGAGYGKSFAVGEVVRRAIEQGYGIKGCATSYVATQVLRQQLDPLQVESGTIASTLKMDVEYEGAKEVYVPSSETYGEASLLLSPGNLLIVDEYSMVSDDIAGIFTRTAQDLGGKLLVVGDAHQLPSPAQSWPSCLDDVEPSVELTTPMRYAEDSTLYRVEQNARRDPWSFEVQAYRDESEVFAYNDWESYVKAFVEAYRANPTLDIRMLWYRRQHMVDANHAIRKAMFGDNPNLVEEGEQLRVQRTGDYPTPGAGLNGSTRFYSGTTYRTLETGIGIAEVLGYRIPCVQAKLDNGITTNLIFSVTEGRADPNCLGGTEFNAALSEIADRCNDPDTDWTWKQYREFRNNFLQVAYSYATTVHRTQGMSADIVFTSPIALKQARPFDAQRLLYVGLTRAKKQLHCLGD